MIKTELKKLTDELKHHPLIQRVDISYADGILPSKFAEVEKQTGLIFENDIREFYSECNGLELQVTYNEDFFLAYNEKINREVNDPFFVLPEDEENKYLGLHILPFEEVFSKQWFNFSSDAVKVFNGESFILTQLAERLRPFDLFSGFTCAAFYLDFPNKDIKVLLLDDHYDDWTSSCLTDFKSYWKIILNGIFSVAARKEILLKTDLCNCEPDLIKSKISRLQKPSLFLLDYTKKK